MEYRIPEMTNCREKRVSQLIIKMLTTRVTKATKRNIEMTGTSRDRDKDKVAISSNLRTICSWKKWKHNNMDLSMQQATQIITRSWDITTQETQEWTEDTTTETKNTTITSIKLRTRVNTRRIGDKWNKTSCMKSGTNMMKIIIDLLAIEW